jgi:hypothetical protein
LAPTQTQYASELGVSRKTVHTVCQFFVSGHFFLTKMGLSVFCVRTLFSDKYWLRGFTSFLCVHTFLSKDGLRGFISFLCVHTFF